MGAEDMTRYWGYVRCTHHCRTVQAKGQLHKSCAFWIERIASVLCIVFTVGSHLTRDT